MRKTTILVAALILCSLLAGCSTSQLVTQTVWVNPNDNTAHPGAALTYCEPEVDRIVKAWKRDKCPKSTASLEDQYKRDLMRACMKDRDFVEKTYEFTLTQPVKN